MPRLTAFLKYWAPVLLWMGVIFAGSTRLGAAPVGSGFIVSALRWVLPGLSDAAADRAVLALRKTGHVTEYAVLAWLLWRAGRKPTRRNHRPWNPRLAGLALLGAAVYAATDELHQAWVPSRQASWADVLLDTAGAALGLVAVWWFGYRRRGG